jgi:hypothetical protein
MPKPTVKAEVNTFVQGLITEASPLNFPSNASFDEENFILNRDGTRNRRLGIDLEEDHTLFSTSLLADYINTKPRVFKWKNVGGIPDLQLQVVQLGTTLMFFDLSKENLSTDGLFGSIVLSSFPADTQFSLASVNGVLVATAGLADVAIIKYSTTFSVEYRPIYTRDLWGIECKIDPRYESDNAFRGDYDPHHYYNLTNQSWGIPRKYVDGSFTDPSLLYRGALGVYPSNSELVWPGLQYQPVASGVDPFERIYPNLFLEVLGASPQTSKGYYIIDAVRRGPSRVAKFNENKTKYPAMATFTLTTNPLDTTKSGCKNVTEFAGRVFYSGFSGEVLEPDSRSPNLANYVFFSQLVKSTLDITKCHQEGDPTSRDNSDVVDTDGGFIRIAGCEKIISTFNLGSSLIVIGSNGVWSISGGSDFGFSATNYKVDKISSFGGISDLSIVEERGRAFYWADNGIFVIARNQLGEYEVNSLTDNTISSYYEKIPFVGKANAVGQYDPVGKRLLWIFSQGTVFTSDYVITELIFDLSLNAFYKHRIINPTDYSIDIVAPFVVAPFRSSILPNAVIADTESVLVGTDSVDILSSEQLSGIQTVKYLVAYKVGSTISLTFANYKDASFRDWSSIPTGGQDAKAFVLTGATTLAASSVQKQIPYLTLHFARTETIVDSELQPINKSGCIMRCQWDWSVSALSRKWSADQQVYRYAKPPKVINPGDAYDTGSDVLTTKNKIRGSGRSFALYLETEPLKDCNILGWSLSLSGNSYV